MTLRRRGKIVVTIVAVLLLAIFLPPFVNVSRYRGRIADSMQRALGRPVTVGSVSLRLFPQPGFDLGNVTVGEDPAFGTEPMLHAEEVRASLRLTSLWRGRLEVAKLSLKYPSLNLVRAADGRWNVEALLQQASRIPTAPTAKTRPESRPRFPYIEAEGGRINFKVGAEKKVYALADSDFALWLASENELRTRLEGRMVRTDSYLSDTGVLKVDGRMQRAWDLRDTPLEITATLKGAQLGQLTKFVDGNDRGWRGEVNADLALGGTPAAMTVQAEAEINDFRRYDIGSVEKLNLSTRCSAKMSAPDAQLTGIACQMPLSGGALTVRGSLTGILDARAYDLSITADKIPVQKLVSLAKHAKKDIPDDLSGQGIVDATMTFRKADTGNTVWSGGGGMSNVILRSSTLQPELELGDLTFSVQQAAPAAKKITTKAIAPAQAGMLTPMVVLAPFTVPVGSAAPVTLSAWISTDGYGLTAQGESRIERAAQIARAAGLRVPVSNIDGQAKLDIAMAGKWADFAAPTPTGTIVLRSVTARMKGVASPLQIASATLNLAPDTLTVSNTNASFSGSHSVITGLVRMPRHCETIDMCRVEFDLHADQVNTDELNRLLNPRVAKRPWYAILGSKPEPSIFTKLQAIGRITADRLTIKALVSSHVSAEAILQAGVLSLNELRSELWGGKQSGTWRADFTQERPLYTGSGTLDSVAMAQLSAAMMHDSWAAGTMSAKYRLSATGFTAPELMNSASAQSNFEWRRGSLRHVSLNGSKGPLSFRSFSGTVEFASGKVRIAPESKMLASSGIYQVSGTASPGQQMDVTFRDSQHVFTVTGTLEQPKVTPAPITETQVSLKQ